MKTLTMATVLALGAVYMLGQVPEAQAQAWFPPYAWVVIGRPDACDTECDPQVSQDECCTDGATSACVAASESHELRCCSDVELTGYQQKNDCSVWAESQLASVGDGTDGCVTAATYEEALSLCNGDGGRLCSVAELESGCTAGTGCFHDYDLIRSSTPCTPDDVGFGGITIRPPSTWIPPYPLETRTTPFLGGVSAPHPSVQAADTVFFGYMDTTHPVCDSVVILVLSPETAVVCRTGNRAVYHIFRVFSRGFI